MDELPSTGTPESPEPQHLASNYGNMLNQYLGSKKKKPKKPHSPWMGLQKGIK